MYLDEAIAYAEENGWDDGTLGGAHKQIAVWLWQLKNGREALADELRHTEAEIRDVDSETAKLWGRREALEARRMAIKEALAELGVDVDADRERLLCQ